ncbi:hypothetical protein [Candidatus Galacturonibacter soehngenii]|uniref:Uncharacterized protein n=1 Tax=Candidatus Galacturonatibacter soehngenii TaxID=2307010 RepID=A0A7V7UC76_9FIRM|nr:hypothetical protein [Candidatus Galacturonibacter soehngenii]KAB1438650.1 hypothetical protein F7O84_14080 [Candidatus Galacturonibacter soehngenii]
MKKVISTFLTLIAGAGVGAAIVKYFNTKNKKYDKAFKFRAYYELLNHWLSLRNKGLSVEKYFVHNGYQNIAIYGMGELGTRLYEELKEGKVCIKYGIDQNGGIPNSDLDIYNMNEELEEVDLIVVSAIFDYNTIEAELKKKGNFNIVSLESVIFSLD